MVGGVRDARVEERRELARVRPADEDARLEGRVRGERQDLAVAGVERDDGPAVRVPVLVRDRRADAEAERRLGRLLQARVDRQAQREARRGLVGRHELAARAPERVDEQLRAPGSAAQEAVEGGLDAALPDLVAELERLALLELRLGHLADVAEHVRPERPARVVAQKLSYVRTPGNSSRRSHR